MCLRIRLGYIEGFSKKDRLGVVVDRFGVRRVFRVDSSHEYLHFVFFEDCGLYADNVQNIENFKLNPVPEFDIQYNCIIYAAGKAVVWDMHRQRHEFWDNPTLFVLGRYDQGLPLMPKNYPAISLDDYTKIVKECRKKVEYINDNLSDVADTYHVFLDFENIYSADDDFIDTTYFLTAFSDYADEYTRKFFKGIGECLTVIKHPYSSERAKNKLKSVIYFMEKEVKDYFLDCYDKEEHLAVLMLAEKRKLEAARINFERANSGFLEYWGITTDMVEEVDDGESKDHGIIFEDFKDVMRHVTSKSISVLESYGDLRSSLLLTPLGNIKKYILFNDDDVDPW